MSVSGTTRRVAAISIVLLFAVLLPRSGPCSTYAVYIPLDSSIYRALDTLNGLGYLDSYLPEIKPITRVEAARLTLEAQSKLDQSDQPNPLARRLVTILRAALKEEVSWVENDDEDNRPTMFHPVQRIETQYVYSSGERRTLDTGSSGIDWHEGTPLLPYNDGIPSASGNNEVLRWSGWAGFGGFLTGYGEGTVAGPLGDQATTGGRIQLLTGAAVVGLGNVALSFGQEETAWGTGQFGLLSQSNNGLPFPALRGQNIHPGHLPSVFRYLGLMRWQAFIAQLDGERPFSHPWLVAQTVCFKTLPWLEWGLNHAVMFGGSGNDNYSVGGAISRGIGIDTGNSDGANTNSRFGAYLRIHFPQLRNTQVYYEILGEDFYQPFGHGSIKTPFKAPSYQVGVYAPMVTADGLTDAVAEWTVLDREYSTHSDSLYWTYREDLMGDTLGPGAWRIEAQAGRWFAEQRKFDLSAFYIERSPNLLVPISVGTNKETSFGGALDYTEIPFAVAALGDSLGETKARFAIEYVNDINYSTHSSLRTLVQLSFALEPSMPSLVWP